MKRRKGAGRPSKGEPHGCSKMTVFRRVKGRVIKTVGYKRRACLL